jgi:hypothetical protein
VSAAPGYTIHATKKLLDRVKRPVGAVEPATVLGNWYATALFWKPQVALFVNEWTFLPVLVPLAPAATLAERFPESLRAVLDQLGVDPRFVDAEIRMMGRAGYAKTANRSVVGMMNEFGFLADTFRRDPRFGEDLVRLAVRLAGTPVGPLAKRQGFPDRELLALVETHLAP